MSTVDLGIRSEQGRLGAADDRPLTDQEYQLLQRLLADPFSFPIQFKTWLVSYLEGSDLTLPISAILGLQALLGITGAGSGALGILPAGIILPYGGAAAPVGTLMCDGASYLNTDQPRLFSAIGTRYGGDATHFNTPDLVGRFLLGIGTHAEVNAPNKNDGLPAGSRTPRHASTPNDPGHAHGVSDPTHGHGVSDGGHSHGVNDPGHAHRSSQVAVGGVFGGTTNLIRDSSNSFGDSSGTGISIQGSGSNIGINGAATGIGIAANGTGISVGPQGGGRPVDTVPHNTAYYIIIA